LFVAVILVVILDRLYPFLTDGKVVQHAGFGNGISPFGILHFPAPGLLLGCPHSGIPPMII
jgi:hypothetical protein